VNRLVVLLFVVSCVALPAAEVRAQGDDEPAVSISEVRIGAWWPEDGAKSRPLFGGRVGFFPWTTGGEHRIGLHATIDYRSLGGVESFDEDLGSQVRVRGTIFALGGFIGVDVARTRHLVVDVRVGGVLVRTRTSFAIDSRNGFSQSVTDGWETLCGFSGFQDRCRTDYDTTGAVAVGIRRNLNAAGDAYVGVDYTRLFSGPNLLVGTIGLSFR
jgi:hypothetical protein